MAIAGRVAIVPKGDWSADATYKRLDAVTYNNTLYFAKKEVPAGTATSNTEYWSKSIVGGASAIATTEDAGVVKPDGKSMSVDESGTLSINLDGTTITLDEAKNVIKLADTLKDKIGSALQPESIVNNQITTEEGFTLDARQANPNIDGSLAKQVAELNGSLTALSHYSITRIHDFLLRDQESKTVVLQDGAYIFINGHINASQITLLKVLNSLGVKTTDIIAPTSTHEVTISGSNNTVAFSANGLCYGHIFYLFPFE